MRTKAAHFVGIAFSLALASAQSPAEGNVDRVFHFTQTETAQDIQQIATVIRAMTEIRQLSAETEKTLDITRNSIPDRAR